MNLSIEFLIKRFSTNVRGAWPPRVVKMARKLGMKGGVSLDLTVPASDGFIWDFSRKHCRDKATEMINDEKPLIIPDAVP